MSIVLVGLIPECWSQTNDVHGLGGRRHDTATLEECQATCILDRTCAAIDWEKGDGGQRFCWILTSTYVAATTQRGLITHFELRRACLGSFAYNIRSLLDVMHPESEFY